MKAFETHCVIQVTAFIALVGFTEGFEVSRARSKL